MAQIVGKNGVLKSGSTTIGEIKSFSIDENCDTVETTQMGDAARTYSATLTSFTGSADAYLDFADTGQDTLTVGSSLTLNVYPEGDTTGNVELQGSIIVTGVSKSQSFDGMAEVSFSFQGSGALSEGTAS